MIEDEAGGAVDGDGSDGLGPCQVCMGTDRFVGFD